MLLHDYKWHSPEVVVPNDAASTGLGFEVEHELTPGQEAEIPSSDLKPSLPVGSDAGVVR